MTSNSTFTPACFVRLRDGVAEQSGTQQHNGGFISETSTCCLEGVFIRWSACGGRVSVQNDRYGIHPGFVFADRNRFAVATSVKEIRDRADVRDLDDEAIAVFLRLGYFIGNDTPFQQIRALEPGSDLQWELGDLKVDHSRACGVPETIDITRPDARRRFGTLFQEAVERLHRDVPGCVPLSGGQDSRHILFALIEAGHSPDFTVTLESPPPRINTDVEVASLVAGSLGLCHQVIAQPPDVLGRELTKNSLTGFCADEHAWLMPIAEFCRQHGIQQSWDGLGGDYLSSGRLLNQQWLDWFRNGDFEILANVFLGDEGYLPKSLCVDQLERWSRSVAVKRLVRELERHADAPNPVMSFFFCNRVRRELALAPFGLVARQCPVMTPFLDRNVFDFLVSLPTEMMLDEQFHIETIREFYPRMPDIPFQSISKFGNDRLPSTVIRRFCRELAAYSMEPVSRSHFVRRSFLLPRLMKGYLNPRFGSSLPITFSRLILLMQLERELAR